MNSLGKYVLTKTQKIVLLVVVFALIAGGYYAGFYLPVQRRIEAADTAELDAQIQLEQMKAMQIRQMEEEIEAAAAIDHRPKANPRSSGLNSRVTMARPNA